VWFRRDLRLSDNLALVAAAAAGGPDGVVPLFVVDPLLWARSGDPRRAFLIGCLEALDEQLGGTLLVRRGHPAQEVRAVARHHRAQAVFVSADFGPYGRRRDEAVGAGLRADGRRLVARGSPYAVDPGTLENASAAPFKVFTPFSKAWRAHGWPQPAPRPDVAFVRDMKGAGLPAAPATRAALPAAGERAALVLLDDFLDARVQGYADRRNRPALPGTSRLSVHLKFGTLHPRTVLARLGQSRDEATFRTELAWREFYADVLWNRPDTARQAFNPGMAGMQVDEGPDADQRFEAWAAGSTGYPLVDAGMRQLQAEAWVHNRVRMIVASFLVKDLHLDWTRGARLFLDRLVDGDLASNHHGWQWVAGTGTDPAPYFRIFNPVAQSRRFDPDGTYIATYVPELACLPPGDRHEPWLARAKGADLRAYPEPIVDHATERQEALRRYSNVRAGRPAPS
jgi:deoxyribodipyrimidine photo-lyase